MLGQALVRAAADAGAPHLGVATQTAPAADVTDDAALARVIHDFGPTVVINAVAWVDLMRCETDPGGAYRVNARPASVLSRLAAARGFYLVQVSTDHYYTGDGAGKHDERAPVQLLNEYARTKYAGELFALAESPALVVRTNIVGFRGTPDRPTFVEWAIAALQSGEPMNLFSDVFTSSIDVSSFAEHLLTLLAPRHTGVVNLACRDVASKRQFIEALAHRLGLATDHVGIISGVGGDAALPRGESLGLDVARVEQWLGQPMPTLDQVVENLAQQHEHRSQT